MHPLPVCLNTGRGSIDGARDGKTIFPPRPRVPFTFLPIGFYNEFNLQLHLPCFRRWSLAWRYVSLVPCTKASVPFCVPCQGWLLPLMLGLAGSPLEEITSHRIAPSRTNGEHVGKAKHTLQTRGCLEISPPDLSSSPFHTIPLATCPTSSLGQCSSAHPIPSTAMDSNHRKSQVTA